eukprot:gene44723-55653_t
MPSQGREVPTRVELDLRQVSLESAIKIIGIQGSGIFEALMSKNPPKVKDIAEAYLQETRSWETDKVIELTKSRRTAWWVASVAG